MIDSNLQRWFMTLGAIALVIIARKFFPGDELIVSLLKDALMLGGGGLLGAAHITKPGDLKGVSE